jgi:uncharacterized protein (DUF433 family)
MSSENRNEVLWIQGIRGERIAKLYAFPDEHGDERWSAREPWSQKAHPDECGFSTKNFDVPFSMALKRALELFPSIAMDADVICGTPRIAGTRIPVYMVLDAVQHYGTVQGALTSYSQLTEQQVKDALLFASAVLEQPVEHELKAFIR